jgi:hypothetical protein
MFLGVHEMSSSVSVKSVKELISRRLSLISFLSSDEYDMRHVSELCSIESELVFRGVFIQPVGCGYVA